LEIEADASEQTLKLTVWDKGIGIKPENIPALFNPFTQIDGGLAREYYGTGLGLSLVYRLVKLHNGDIEVNSTFGKGSFFVITLPWPPQSTLAAPNVLPRYIAKDTSPLNYSKDSNPPKIVIVEDNEVVLQMVAEYLEAKQYRVYKTGSGVEMLEQIDTLRPDAIVMDVQMPGINGFEAMRKVRSHKDPVIAAIPIIAVTALAMSGDRERCVEAGANEYMSKPLKLLELAATIRTLIGKK
jgi:CheY-like chemotaxis protein